jgi:SMI1 / KNR4 family (SUKH-1)
MDYHIKEFFSKDSGARGNFYNVIALHEAPDIDWSRISRQVPSLSKGWYELSRLKVKDRIEFTRDFWLSKLTYREGFSEFLIRFFDSLDDVGIYIMQKKFEDPFDVNLVYSLKEDSGFYRGGSPASEEAIEKLQAEFPEFLLPGDFLAFLQIHDGFWKTTDCTGIVRSCQMRELYERFQEIIRKLDILKATEGIEVDPSTLIPFYESFGMPFFQCFWAEWYPEEEMGNIYYSDLAKSISCSRTGEPHPENMAFPTFIDWLKFYLERIA